MTAVCCPVCGRALAVTAQVMIESESDTGHDHYALCSGCGVLLCMTEPVRRLTYQEYAALDPAVRGFVGVMRRSIVPAERRAIVNPWWDSGTEAWL